MKVLIHGAAGLGPGAKAKVEKAARAALGPRAKRSGELCVVFASDAQVHGLNKRFLGHDYDTDVIAFPYPQTKGVKGDAPFGDVYVALGVAKRQAKERDHPLLREAATLAVHGTLHLVGYDDSKPAAKKRMFARQDRLVAGLFPDGKEKKTAR